MLRICNGTLVTPEGLTKADLWVDKGKIIQIGGELGKAERYDAAGCLVFPGFIDAHTHLGMDAGATWTADDWASGTAAALAGGTTAVLDFATQDRGGSLQTALDTWHSRADGAASCDYGFHMAVTDWNAATAAEIPTMAAQGVTSFKAYMAYDNLRISDGDLRELLRATRDIGFVGVHCELGDEVNAGIRALLAAGKTGPENHPKSRPNAVEGRAVARFLDLAAEAEAPAWVVHLSTREGLAAIEAARARGQKVLVETCPQYLTLTDEVYIRNGFEGAKYVCSPPIRSQKDQDTLWKAVEGNGVDIISTDHCSFNFSGQKELGRQDFSKIPNGLPGIEHRPALIWTEGVGKGRLTALAFMRLLSENPARAFGLYPRKGAVASGSDADLVIWDTGAEAVLRAENQVMHCDYSPWEGWALKGLPRAVFLHGVLCAEKGRVLRTGQGTYLRRERSLM